MINGRAVEVCGQVQVVSAASMHKSGVRGVDYNPVTSTLVSCSGDPRASLVVWGPDHATKTYTFSMPKVLHGITLHTITPRSIREPEIVFSLDVIM